MDFKKYVTKEHIEKRMLSIRGKPNLKMRGENNPAKRPEIRKKISEKLKGKLRIKKAQREKIICKGCNKQFEAIISHRRKVCSKKCQKIYQKSDEYRELQRLRAYQRKCKPKYINTKPEVMLQEELTINKIRYETHKRIYGVPDIFIEPNICVFVDGNYWHNYPNGRDKDKEVNKKLKEDNYIVVRCWESDIYNNMQQCINEIKNIVG